PSGPRERWIGFPRRAHRRGAVLRRPSAAEPPSPSRNPVRAPSHLPVASSALRTPRRYSTAKPNPERTPGALDWFSPASSPPRSRAPATQRRRAALAVEEPRPSSEPPPCGLQCITHATAVLHGQTEPRADPGSAGLVFPGELTAAEPCS